MIKNLLIIAILLGVCCEAPSDLEKVLSVDTEYLGSIEGGPDGVWIIKVEGKRFLYTFRYSTGSTCCLIPD